MPSPSFTVRELRNILNEAVQEGREDDPVRVVYHGWTKPSFNLPVHDACVGPNNDFLVITEEPRTTDPDAPNLNSPTPSDRP